MSGYSKLIARWQALNKKLLVLEIIKKKDPDELHKIRIQLRNLIMDIQEMVDEGIPEEKTNKALRKIRDECKRYQAIALAA